MVGRGGRRKIDVKKTGRGQRVGMNSYFREAPYKPPKLTLDLAQTLGTHKHARIIQLFRTARTLRGLFGFL